MLAFPEKTLESAQMNGKCPVFANALHLHLHLGLRYFLVLRYSPSFLLISSDINECDRGLHSCHVNGLCTNTDGSYVCRCLKGFIGDGRSCKGQYFGYDLAQSCPISEHQIHSACSVLSHFRPHDHSLECYICNRPIQLSPVLSHIRPHDYSLEHYLSNISLSFSAMERLLKVVHKRREELSNKTKRSSSSNERL